MARFNYTKEPVYSTLKDITLFENVSVKCIKFDTDYELDFGEVKVTRRYKAGSFLITRGEVVYIHGQWETELVTSRTNIVMVVEFNRDLNRIRPLLKVASNKPNKEIRVRQRGINRGHAYFVETEKGKCYPNYRYTV